MQNSAELLQQILQELQEIRNIAEQALDAAQNAHDTATRNRRTLDDIKKVVDRTNQDVHNMR